MLRLQGVTKRELRMRLTRDWAALVVEWRPGSRLLVLSKFILMMQWGVEEMTKLDTNEG